jgi:oligopeptide/dipeptide ABC transporter ATP-binding protein
LIADEFTTNLDVTTQAEVMRLIQELQQDFQMSVLLISHDLALMSEYCHSIGIIYAGQMVETGHVRSVLTEPAHPYTRGLLSCIPDFNTSGGKLNVIGGRVPALIEPPTGCRYHPRCPHAIKGLCEMTAPVETRLSESHFTWCHLYQSLQS